MTEKIIEVALHEHIGIQVDTAVFDELLQAYDVGTMCNVIEAPAEYLSWCLDLDVSHQRATQLPPGTLGLILVIEKDLFRRDALNRTFQTDVMHEAPRLPTEVLLHAKRVMKNLWYTAHRLSRWIKLNPPDAVGGIERECKTA
jgi:hypothetical protein